MTKHLVKNNFTVKEALQKKGEPLPFAPAKPSFCHNPIYSFESFMVLDYLGSILLGSPLGNSLFQGGMQEMENQHGEP